MVTIFVIVSVIVSESRVAELEHELKDSTKRLQRTTARHHETMAELARLCDSIDEV